MVPRLVVYIGERLHNVYCHHIDVGAYRGNVEKDPLPCYAGRGHGKGGLLGALSQWIYLC